jgi:DNA polymerase III subunit epsilon
VARTPEIVAARRCEPTPGWRTGGWEVVLIRYGRLAGTCVTPAGSDPMPHIAALRATGEVVAPPAPGRPGLLVEETDVLIGWLEQPGVRLVSLDDGRGDDAGGSGGGGADAPVAWASPVRGAGWARHHLRGEQ